MKRVCSWSGGKDSAMALYRVGLSNVSSLFTMTSSKGYSRSHGIPEEILKKQGEYLQIPWRGAIATWATYEEVFLQNIKDFQEEEYKEMIFGDIDIQGHREWNKMICKKGGIEALLPLWQENQLDLVNEFLRLDFQAILVSINLDFLPIELLGEKLCPSLLQKIIKKGCTPGGERGEYHTLVTSGPIFTKEIQVHRGEKRIHESQAFLHLSLIE